MPYGRRPVRGGRGGMPPQRRGRNCPTDTTGGGGGTGGGGKEDIRAAGRCAGIANPGRRADCMRASVAAENRRMQWQQNQLATREGVEERELAIREQKDLQQADMAEIRGRRGPISNRGRATGRPRRRRSAW